MAEGKVVCNAGRFHSHGHWSGNYWSTHVAGTGVNCGHPQFYSKFWPAHRINSRCISCVFARAGNGGMGGRFVHFVQVAESNFITPMVQKKLVNIPPAMIIIAQLLIAPLTGGWGLVLATPLMVIIIVMVKELYIKNQGAHE